MKRLASIGLSILAFAALTGLNLLIFTIIAERDRLESRNDVERTNSALLAGLRDHDDFGSAIESDTALREKVLGVGAYAADGAKLYSWGEVPSVYSNAAVGEASGGDAGRIYVDNSKKDSIILIHHPFRGGPPSPRIQREVREPTPSAARRAPSGFLFTTLRNAESVYLEIHEPAYWRSRRLDALLSVLVEAAIAALILALRGLIIRNSEYRRRIEEQESLVVLGTAASTLAHEIKNPLLSIRIQTHILEKTWPREALREIGIINDEVERLSALSQRVGDYLRDPAGRPSAVDPREIAGEVGRRMCGRDLLAASQAAPPLVHVDPERLRSIPIVEPEATHQIGLVVPLREPSTPLTVALVAEATYLAKSMT